MAKVPYTPYPTAAPDSSPTSGIGINTPGAAFGENVASAFSHLGKVAEHAGDEIFSRAVAMQQLANQTEAVEADTNYMIKVGELHAEYSSLQGKARVDAFPKYTENMQKLRQDMRKGLSNDASRKLFDSSSLSTMSRSIFNGAGQAASANKEWAVGTASANMELDIETVEDNPRDDILFQNKLARVRASAAEISALKGFDPGGPQEQELVLSATSKLWSRRIIGLSRTEPFEAVKVLAANKAQMTGADYLKTDNSVRAQGRAVGSINIANQVYQSGLETDDKPGKTLAQMEAEARTVAEAQDPNDPILAKSAVAELRNVYNQDKYARRQEELNNVQTVADGIQAGVRSERELRMNPKVAAAIDALPKTKQLEIPGQINRFNTARDKVTNQTNEQRIYGMSNNDVEAFLNLDLTNEQLSQGDIVKYRNLQKKLKERPQQDPRVNRAIGQMRGALGAQMEALGIYGRTESNKEDYDQFTGAVSSALDVWQETHGKPATAKDVIDTIGPDIIRQRSEPGVIFGSMWPNKKAFFQQTVPAKFEEQIKADVIAKGGVEPTAEQINRAYVRSQLIKLYEKKDGTTAPKR